MQAYIDVVYSTRREGYVGWVICMCMWNIYTNVPFDVIVWLV